MGRVPRMSRHAPADRACVSVCKCAHVRVRVRACVRKCARVYLPVRAHTTLPCAQSALLIVRGHCWGVLCVELHARSVVRMRVGASDMRKNPTPVGVPLEYP